MTLIRAYGEYRRIKIVDCYRLPQRTGDPRIPHNTKSWGRARSQSIPPTGED